MSDKLDNELILPNIVDTKGAVVWSCPCCKHEVYEGDNDEEKPVGIAMGELPLIICTKCNVISVSDSTIEALTAAMKQVTSSIIQVPPGAHV